LVFNPRLTSFSAHAKIEAQTGGKQSQSTQGDINMAEIKKWPDELKVQIQTEFKEGLSQRFGLTNAIRNGKRIEIIRDCVLCLFYTQPVWCRGCPFARFEKSDELGCSVWIRNIIRKPVFRFHNPFIVFWSRDNDQKAREQLTLLRQAAEQLIEWI